MVKHIILWKLKDELTDKQAKAQEIKVALENLMGKIEGLIEMYILTENLPSSSSDIMLDSSFTDNSALQYYQKHPLHVKIAEELVRPSVQTRASFDYEI